MLTPWLEKSLFPWSAALKIVDADIRELFNKFCSLLEGFLMFLVPFSVSVIMSCDFNVYLTLVSCERNVS